LAAATLNHKPLGGTPLLRLTTGAANAVSACGT